MNQLVPENLKIARASQLKSALSERQRTVSEFINESQSEEEESAEHTTAILGNSPLLENSDNSRFVPSLKTGVAVAVKKRGLRI